LPEDALYDRELSWLAFNERVLQEAESPDVPLFERVKFLGIFSSNLDEFFRVRVAALRSVLADGGEDDPEVAPVRELVETLTRRSVALQERFGRTFREEVLPGLEAAGLRLLDDGRVPDRLDEELASFFEREVLPLLRPRILGRDEDVFLKDHTVYLVVELHSESRSAFAPVAAELAVVEVPSRPLHRFFWCEAPDGVREVFFLDDVIRYCLPTLFPDWDLGKSWAIKVSRDAELYLDEEFAGSLKERIRAALGRRERGAPIRFLYDQRMPAQTLARLVEVLRLRPEDLVEGGRYHNLHDLLRLPLPDRPEYRDPPLPALAHPRLTPDACPFAVVRAGDELLHPPYQAYDPVVRFMARAAADDAVERIWISLYRVDDDSAVVQSLIDAAGRGKRVTAFVEVQARFDEARNLAWAERMEAAGVRVLYGREGIKVHAKLALVERAEEDGARRYAYLATGNFNERTARVYSDHGLFTVHEGITAEVRGVFRLLEDGLDGALGEIDAAAARAEGASAGGRAPFVFEHLLVAPRGLRPGLYALIDDEIAAARRGEPCGITAKLNALEDPDMIARLYEACRAGVEVRLIVRGICRARPGLPGLSENMTVVSLVDRFLEHSRIYRFHAGGRDLLYLASADWMRRNLSRRVEVAFPVLDPRVRAELEAVLDLQFRDNVKARIIDAEQSNRFVERGDAPPCRCQIETYRFLEGLLEAREDEHGE